MCKCWFLKIFCFCFCVWFWRVLQPLIKDISLGRRKNKQTVPQQPNIVQEEQQSDSEKSDNVNYDGDDDDDDDDVQENTDLMPQSEHVAKRQTTKKGNLFASELQINVLASFEINLHNVVTVAKKQKKIVANPLKRKYSAPKTFGCQSPKVKSRRLTRNSLAVPTGTDKESDIFSINKHNYNF